MLTVTKIGKLKNSNKFFSLSFWSITQWRKSLQTAHAHNSSLNQVCCLRTSNKTVTSAKKRNTLKCDKCAKNSPVNY